MAKVEKHGSASIEYVGALIKARYLIDRLIGEGGFAWVFHAHAHAHAPSPAGALRPRHAVEVAVKVLHSKSETAAARFDREIKVLRALPRNPHVAGHIDDGVDVHGRRFLVLDYVDGETLVELMGRHRSLPPRQAVAFVAELCEAFAGLHQLGVAHRDVKPENILLARQGGIKLIDFGLIRDAQGLLKLLEQQDPFDHRIFAEELDHRSLVGTPEYMAPEQFSDAIEPDLSLARTDTWSDVFSLGVILFELITGRVPFPMPTVPAGGDVRKEIFRYMRRRIKLGDVDLPACSGIDPALDSILQTALRHDPRQRQPDARALGADLDRYLKTGRGVMLSYASKTLAVPVEELGTQEFAAPVEDSEVGRATMADERWVDAPSSERDAEPARASTASQAERVDRPSNPWGEPAFSLDELCASDGASADLKILALPVDVRSIADEGSATGESAETPAGSTGERLPSDERDDGADRAARRSATIRWFELPPTIAAEIAEHDPSAPPDPLDAAADDLTTGEVDVSGAPAAARAEPESADVTRSYETPGSVDLEGDPE